MRLNLIPGFRNWTCLVGFAALAWLPARVFPQTYGSEQINQIAIEIRDWNMTETDPARGGFTDLWPKDRYVGFPAGLLPQNILSISAVIQNDAGTHAHPLRVNTNNYWFDLKIPPSPGGNIRVELDANAAPRFALHAFGTSQRSLFRDGSPYDPNDASKTGSFSAAGHRGWIYVTYKGAPVNPGTSTSLFTTVHTLFLPFGPWETETETGGYRSLRIPSDIAVGNIVDMHAAFVDDNLTQVTPAEANAEAVGAMHATAGRAYIGLGRGHFNNRTPQAFYSDLSGNRGWMVIHYKGTKSVKADMDPNLESRALRSVYALGTWDMGNVVAGTVAPTQSKTYNAALHDLAAIGSVTSMVRSDQGYTSPGFMLEDFNSSPVCRDYLIGAEFGRQDDVGSQPFICRASYAGRGGYTTLGSGKINASSDMTGGFTRKTHTYFSATGTGTNPPKWRSLSIDRGYATIEQATLISPLYHARPNNNIRTPAGRSKLFSFHVPEGASNPVLELSAFTETGDANLFVKKGRIPELDDADCASKSTGISETCSQGNGLSGPGDYYIRVYGQSGSPQTNLTGRYDYPSFRNSKIGDGLAGSTVLSDVVQFQGSGSGIEGSSDNFYFANQSLTGDGELIARMDLVQGSGVNAKCGLMLRSSVAGNSGHVSVFHDAAYTKSSLEYRPAASAATTVINSNSRNFLKLIKRGNVISAWAADANASGLPDQFWEYIGETTVGLGNRFLGGVAVTNDDPSGTCDCFLTGYQVKFPDAFQQNTSTTDNLIAVQGENFDGNAPKNSHSWGILSASDASGGSAVQVGPNSGGSFTTSIAANSPRLDYRINFAKTGTYYLWTKGKAASGNDDSYHAGLDGVVLSTSDNLNGFGTAFAWSKSSVDGPVATFTISTPGVHVLNVWMREDGFILDKLVLTTNSAYVPTGDGPAESGRSSQASVLEQGFSSNTGGFVYRDNAFRGATQGNYASGTRNSGGYLTVSLGGVDANSISNISGGWQSGFSLGKVGTVTLSFSYRMNVAAAYEADEYGEVLVKVDDKLVSGTVNDYVQHIADGGGSTTFATVSLNLGTLYSGAHTLALGAYNNKKNASDETMTVDFDNVKVSVGP